MAKAVTALITIQTVSLPSAVAYLQRQSAKINSSISGAIIDFLKQP